MPLLCCRGSHRKLEKAKWNARASQGLFEQTIHDISQTESLITSTLDDGDAHTSTMTTSTQVYLGSAPVCARITLDIVAENCQLRTFVWKSCIFSRSPRPLGIYVSKTTHWRRNPRRKGLIQDQRFIKTWINYIRICPFLLVIRWPLNVIDF